MDQFTVDNMVLKLVEGDITALHVDAIVNAANTGLQLGAGVAGAIRRRGGPLIQKECNELIEKYGSIKTGDAVITNGGKLAAKYVIHTAGPIYSQYNPAVADQKLKNSVLNSLKYLEDNKRKINSIAFPAISAGIYGFPQDKCAKIMISTILDFMEENKEKKEDKTEITICLFGQNMFSLFKNKLKIQLEGKI
ncbi:MAG: macro domain-containing protein [archaeon]|nr:macro domain-containing protein [archaeon]